MYEFHRISGLKVSEELIAEMSKLYSDHYGVWGTGGKHPGSQVRLSSKSIRNWLVDDSYVVWATLLGRFVGYAIAVHKPVDPLGKIAWITQFVVHKEHRRADVGKRLLFSMWRFSDFFAWGLLTANPYAVRALEKATKRRCHPRTIAQHAEEILSLGEQLVHYVAPSIERKIDDLGARVNTVFNVDHSDLPQMLGKATSETKPWTLGDLPDGWEWMAFTFHDQEQIPWEAKELEEMMLASDEITKQAYSRMRSEWGGHPWARYAAEEVEFILRNSGVPKGALVVDFGCGNGRHAIRLAESGYYVTAIDYAREKSEDMPNAEANECLARIKFHQGDCRTVDLSKRFDLGICLYDVVGSFVDDHSNIAILKNLARHINDGGYAFISVMNMELTEHQAVNWFAFSSEPQKLQSLLPGNVMESSGNVFIPKYYMVDRETKIVYRKEQFRSGDELFEECLVRDRRFTCEEIVRLCVSVGFRVEWARYVRAGHWEEQLDSTSSRAKEILVKCQKPYPAALQPKLFL